MIFDGFTSKLNTKMEELFTLYSKKDHPIHRFEDGIYGAENEWQRMKKLTGSVFR
jgi:hypothetical protein